MPTNFTLPETTPVGHDADRVIVYFDGVCGFCNGVVNFLMKHDPRGKLVYAPLQGETARHRLESADINNLNTLVVTIGDRTYRRSAAVVRILWQLGGFCWLLGWMLWLIPKPLRDLGYGIVAKFRYRLFGKHESCRLPTPEERDRFLS
ncbi:thiol-disulfide oxidoreductase DCC family protein [Planctomicrobium sp. SH661]|uniref:thiol-disulfide oxidoreductase DCC family protein n=1 Tax=Planctomicrobium sp. SH661 TaxID=3448124 RepID=UPI003F5BC91E